MLDVNLIEQLRGLFADLDKNVTFEVASSDHADQQNLLDLLNGVASASNRLEIKLSDHKRPYPAFSIKVDGKKTGVNFVGIPGGHEFSSLILAVLNAAGKGKLPDAGLANRIRRLPSAIDINTYISLTCENCPDVVQALNQIALIHGNLQHTMIDGQYVQDELGQLNIQGVPAVVIGGSLVHSGRTTLAELLAKIEAHTGASSSDATIATTTDLGHFDVAVLGGGPAGASAAIYSVRKGLSTVLIAEKMGGQVQETKGIENLISVIYTEGPQLAASLDKHLRSYPVQILEHRRALKVEKLSDGKTKIQLDSGELLTTDSLIVATGAKWRELGVPGEKEYIGRGVAFCPHCDGPYYKNKAVAVVGGGNSGVEAAIDLAGICSEVTLFEFTDKLKADDVLIKKMQTLTNVKVHLNAKTAKIEGNGEKVTGITWEDRVSTEKVTTNLDGVFVQIGLSPNSSIVKELVETNKFGEIVVDAKGRTSSPGIYASGDVTTVPYKQIVIAMGEGAKVALTAFEDRMRKQAS